MQRYVALLRGINVGGKAMIKMAELKIALTNAGFEQVITYIQSGNVIFTSGAKDKDMLRQTMQTTLLERFNLPVDVAIFSAQEWCDIVSSAPSWWGDDKTWKHNLLILIGDHNMRNVVTAIGTLKPGIEKVEPGQGVLYQSMSLEKFGRTTTGKLASSPIYKQMTIRNFNTSSKLAELLKS